MNGMALLGIILIVYGAFTVFAAIKKPKLIWDMAKIQWFRKRMGEKGTVVMFFTIAAVSFGFGIWLLIR